MEFKNLAEVTKLEEVPEGASVLAATAEGEVVRVPGSGLGGGGNAGGGVFTVTFSSADGETFTADKTLSEIEAAYVNGEFVRGKMVQILPFGTMYTEVPFVKMTAGGFAQFCAAMYSENALSTMSLSVYADGTVASEVLNYDLA